ncbi:nucleoside hydrolase [Paenibacillus radicis (ex Xue et al. 2023)]|uniref:Nucleoside hydrolase n=1 Tax=Paenibacillus radicis (ex Xue et al. 2023) TaxID=2972489 RepID=A0ABT1YK50_9BACL|nr:nucleoside hydrolase [Paenibacillus radicis (ex Xue et al. 2023)]MCR8632638.1 nucleoside hydrolase [Paenibacillus radicis (ex Xue et al. 2023)]
MKKVILDVDTGIDDALAIAYAVGSPEIELLGITTTYGMVTVDLSSRNTLKILEHLQSAIPVFKGSDKPLVRTRQYSGKFHGHDGLGEAVKTPPERRAESQHAVDFIIEQIRQYEKDLTLITTGPLTNLAHALIKEPDIIHKIGQVVSMGGAVATPGNATKFAEANIIIDPHAANIVFKSELPIILVGLDVTRKTLLKSSELDNWRSQGTELSLLLAEATQFYMNAYKENYPYLDGCALHDPLAVGVVTHPEIVKTVPMYIDVDLDEDSLGRTIEDVLRTSTSSTSPNTHVCFEVDSTQFVEHFLNRVC